MELSKLPFTLNPKNTVSDLSITPYFPFARVVPVDQEIVALETHVHQCARDARQWYRLWDRSAD
jgi:hypothetical protein